jgi:PiT family inorganic phosphate transporter
VILAVAAALAFAVTNGLHDAANSIATLVATRAARPAAAILLAVAGTVVGPILLGSKVADVIAGVVTVPPDETSAVLGAALTGATVWNLVTWRRGLPSSSGHALFGGLVGAALLSAGSGGVSWGGFDGFAPVGVLGFAVVLTVAPLFGVAAGWLSERSARTAVRRATRRLRGPVRAGQWIASGSLAVAHGANDGQKSVGVMVAVLVAAGELHGGAAPLWVELAAAGALTVGTALGGWPIVRTIGRRIVRLRPLDALASQTGSAAVLLGASALGAPVSTTQVVASSVVGAGGGRGRWHHVHWPVVRAMVIAWGMTVPASALLAGIALVPWRWLT